MNCFDHFALGKLHAPYLGEGVQLVPLNGQNRLEVQHRRQRGRGGRDPAALFQVLHGIHGDVDAGIIGVLFQKVPDLSRVIPLLDQTKGADDRLLLGDGDAVIIHHLHPAVVVLREQSGALTGAAQAAGHGNIHDLIIALCQNSVPQLHELPRRRLGGGDIPVLPQGVIQLLRRDVKPLVVDGFLQIDGHGQDINAQLFALHGGNSAVGIRCDCDFHSAIVPFFLRWGSHQPLRIFMNSSPVMVSFSYR